MGLLDKLTAKLGRAPTDAELQAAKDKKAAKKAKKAEEDAGAASSSAAAPPPAATPAPKPKATPTTPSSSSTRKREPSAYNIFMKSEIQRIKQAEPGLDHKQAFSRAAFAWRTSPDNPKRVDAATAAADAAAAAAEKKEKTPAATGTKRKRGSDGLDDKTLDRVYKAVGKAFTEMLDGELADSALVSESVRQRIVSHMKEALTPNGLIGADDALASAIQEGISGKKPKVVKPPKAAPKPKTPKGPKGPKHKPGVQHAALKLLSSFEWDVFDAVQGAGKQGEGKLSNVQLKQLTILKGLWTDELKGASRMRLLKVLGKDELFAPEQASGPAGWPPAGDGDEEEDAEEAN